MPVTCRACGNIVIWESDHDAGCEKLEEIREARARRQRAFYASMSDEARDAWDVELDAEDDES